MISTYKSFYTESNAVTSNYAFVYTSVNGFKMYDSIEAP